MKKVLLSVLIVVLMLTMLAPSNTMAGSPQSLADSQMSQITGGDIVECGLIGYVLYCCFDLWILTICVGVGFGS